MKRLVLMLAALFLSLNMYIVSALSENNEKMVARYDGEIRFQDAEWLQSDKVTVNAIAKKGLINRNFFSGSGYKGCFYWPEDEAKLCLKYNRELLPSGISENGNVGVWNLQYTPLKTIGGYEPNRLLMHYLSKVRNNKVSDKCDQCVAILVEYGIKTEGKTMSEVFIDLLSKLSAQYGKFDVYVHMKLEELCSYDEGEQHLTAKELVNLSKPYAASASRMNFDGVSVRAYCVIHGDNDTGIVLRWVNKETIELVYGKTNTAPLFQEIATALEEANSQKQEAGL